MATIDEKREHQRSSICRKIRFSAGAKTCIGLIGDISSGGISILSKHKLIPGSLVDLTAPPLSGTVQYCIPYRMFFFRIGLRLLENNR